MTRAGRWAALLLVAGCASVEPPPPMPVESETAPVTETPVPRRPPPPPVAARPSDIELLVTEFQRLRRLPPADVGREQETARQLFTQSRSDSARVRLAMTFALPGSGSNDENRALEILDPVLKNPSSAVNALAVLLAAYIQEQRRLGTQMQGLQQKLDALKTLERSLTERGEPAPRRK